MLSRLPIKTQSLPMPFGKDVVKWFEAFNRHMSRMDCRLSDATRVDDLIGPFSPIFMEFLARVVLPRIEWPTRRLKRLS